MKPAVALLLVDLQNAFCRTKGSYCRRTGPLLDIDATLRSCRRLREMAREQNLPVIFTKVEFRNDYSDAGLLVARIAPQIKAAGAYARGSWDAALTSSLKPLRGDLTISKTRYDPFVGTNLESTLRRRGISRLVIAGVLTNVCVESAARSAFDRDFEVVVASDATTTYSAAAKNASLRLIRRHFGTVIRVREAGRAFDIGI